MGVSSLWGWCFHHSKRTGEGPLELVVGTELYDPWDSEDGLQAALVGLLSLGPLALALFGQVGGRTQLCPMYALWRRPGSGWIKGRSLKEEGRRVKRGAETPSVCSPTPHVLRLSRDERGWQWGHG